MTAFHDALAISMAELTQSVTPSTGELGYGTDLACVTDLSADLAEVDPLSPSAIGQALVRRLSTARGTLIDDPNYGLDVRGFCNHGVPVKDLRDIGGAIRLELVKDDRVQDVTVTVTQPYQTGLKVVIVVVPAVIGLAPFDLTFAIADGVIVPEST
ncbi:MAG: hypothetical protein H0X39_00460 [Actinobacteria bacterium]|nr:hypothetical protein [Actinomycetota bacterium]